MRGKMVKVEGRTNTTEIVFGDPDFLQRQAWEEWPDLDWQIEKIVAQKYLVKGNARGKGKVPPTIFGSNMVPTKGRITCSFSV
jgi:hypothetical protein